MSHTAGEKTIQTPIGYFFHLFTLFYFIWRKDIKIFFLNQISFLFIGDGSISLHNHFGKKKLCFLIKLNTHTSYGPAISVLCMLEINSYNCTYGDIYNYAYKQENGILFRIIVYKVQLYKMTDI